MSRQREWQGVLPQAHYGTEEVAAAQGSLGELAAPMFPCSLSPAAKVWGWGESQGELHAGDSRVTSDKGAECFH